MKLRALAAVAILLCAEPAAEAPAPSRRCFRGVSSYYARSFFGRLMANGLPFLPHHRYAANRWLPLGTRVIVRNLYTGRAAVLRIEDRGPYVDGRILDVSPGAARYLGFARDGLGVVEVCVVPKDTPLGPVK